MASGLLGSSRLRLPNELALLVLDHLADDNQTLCVLARTCRGMQHLAEEHMYKTIALHSVKDLEAIIDAFASRHDRVRAVHTLKILYQYRPEDLFDSDISRTAFNECVAHMVHLREWHIESPYDNFQWGKAGGREWVERDMARFRCALEAACVDGPKEEDTIVAECRLGKNLDRTVGLAQLETLTIHSHGANADFWELEDFHCLFRHPSLRHLHISCITFPAEELPDLAAHVCKTPLTKLVFDECELEPKSLLSILRTPARLKHLTLGENVFNVHQTRRIRPVLSRDAGASLEALLAVAHSLESLTHLDPGWRLDFSSHTMRSVKPPGEGMRNFHSLKYLECDTTSFLHQGIIMNRDLAPPNLEIIRVRRHWDVAVDFWDQTPDMINYMALAPTLTTLELMQSSYIDDLIAQTEYICEEQRLRNRHASAYKLFKAGINLKMLVEMHRDPQLIPPYLHGERIPFVHCLYDASTVGFLRHIHRDSKATVATAYEECGDTTALNLASEPKLPEEVAPETDQLGDADIKRLINQTRGTLNHLRRRFNHSRRLSNVSSADLYLDDPSENDGVEVDDLDEDEDMELELELELDEDEFGDETQIYEHNGAFYIAVYESGSESENGDENQDMEADQQNSDLD